MPLLKSINFCLLLLVLAACSHQGMKTNIDADVNSQLIEIPKQAALDFKQAIALVNEGKMDKALDAFSKMTELYPQLSGPYANIGVIHSRRADYEKAEIFLKLAKEKNPKNHKAINQLGFVYRHMGQFKSAQQEYELSISLSPTTAEYYKNLGILFDLYMGDLVSAKIQYEKYQSLLIETDLAVAGWIVDINRRSGVPVQVAGEGQP